MSAERYGFEVSAWVEPKHYVALRADVNRAIAHAIAAERERCAKIADSFTCGACGMDGKAGEAIRGPVVKPRKLDMVEAMGFDI